MPLIVSRQPRLPHRPGRADHDVPQLTGRTVRALVELAAEDQAGAHAIGHHDVDEVLVAPSRAKGPLRDGAQVGVVAEVHRQVQGAAELADHIDPAPDLEQIRPGRQGRDRRGDSYADAKQPLCLDASLMEQRRHLDDDVVEGMLRVVVDVQLAERLSKQRSGQIGKGNPDPVVAEMYPYQGTEGRVDGEQHGGPPGTVRWQGAGTIMLLDECVLGKQFGDNT